ncbi:MAG TPA: WYL domain-containing protein, partial [Micromonosporaceae bacterium]|nr:WYL domain-containing protein [Micromonosporaceae bacterium]
ADELTRALAAVIPLRRGLGVDAPAGPVPAQPGVADVAGVVDVYAGQLDDRERRLLTDAIRLGSPVTIDYLDAGGYASTRVIEPLELDRHLLTAWCHLRSDERVFALDRIETVRV